MSILHSLAAKIAAMSLDQVPSGALQTAKIAIMDTIGVALAGAASDAARIAANTVLVEAGTGGSLIFGQKRYATMLDAAFVNGTAAHALDFDDTSNSMGGHPSAPVVPAIWSLAEFLGATGGEFLAAYVAGLETQARLGRAVNPQHYEKGWHPTATLGVFGAAAASSRLLGLSAEKTTEALALAVSMASGVKASLGTMAKACQVGHAARNGLLAALLARNGMQANPESLEHRQGFFNVFNGTGNFRPEAVLEGWGIPWELSDPGLGFKRHPCCASTHSAADAILTLLARRPINISEVVSVECLLHPRRLGHIDRPAPRSGLDAKFSIQYVIARALMHGFLGLEHFSDSAVREPEVNNLIGRITAKADPDAIIATNEHYYAKLSLRLNSGEWLEAFVDRAVGRDNAHPIPEDTLRTKFLDCAGQVLNRRSTKSVMDLLLQLENIQRIETISHTIANGMNFSDHRPGRQLSA
jgi:2-methylcitrate dehydratase PrpD